MSSSNLPPSDPSLLPTVSIDQLKFNNTTDNSNHNHNTVSPELASYSKDTISNVDDELNDSSSVHQSTIKQLQSTITELQYQLHLTKQKHTTNTTQSNNILPTLIDDNNYLSNRAQLIELCRDSTLSTQIDDLLDIVKPSRKIESSRLDIVAFVRSVVRRSLGAQLFTTGSFALKVYLHDESIHLSAFFSKAHNTTWLQRIVNALCNEAAGDNNMIDDPANQAQLYTTTSTHHQVQSVSIDFTQYNKPCITTVIGGTAIQIYANETAALASLAIFETVDRLIGKSHLFKRTILLLKSFATNNHILGYSAGLCSNLFLRTLVLFVFNVFHDRLSTPVEAIAYLLTYLKSFDWDKYALSIYGPIELDALDNNHIHCIESIYDNTFQLNDTKPLLSPLTLRHYMQQGSKHATSLSASTSQNSLKQSSSTHNLQRVKSFTPNAVQSLAPSIHQSSSSIQLNNSIRKVSSATHINTLNTTSPNSTVQPYSPLHSTFVMPLTQSKSSVELNTHPSNYKTRRTHFSLFSQSKSNITADDILNESSHHDSMEHESEHENYPIKSVDTMYNEFNDDDTDDITYADIVNGMYSRNNTATQLWHRTSICVVDCITPTLNLGASIDYKNQFTVRNAFNDGASKLVHAGTQHLAIHTSNHYIAAHNHPVLKQLFNESVLIQYDDTHTIHESNTSVTHPVTPPAKPEDNVGDNDTLLLSTPLTHAASVSDSVNSAALSLVEHVTNSDITGNTPLLTHVSSTNSVQSIGNSTQPIIHITPSTSNNVIAYEGDVDRIMQNLASAKQFDTPQYTEDELVELTRSVLSQHRGTIPVGRIGSLLHDATNNHSLPAMLKEKYGGLKKLLERHPDTFIISNDHPFNPSIKLKQQPIGTHTPYYNTINHQYNSVNRDAFTYSASTEFNDMDNSSVSTYDHRRTTARRRTRRNKSNQQHNTNSYLVNDSDDMTSHAVTHHSTRPSLTDILAIDCEFVGTSPSGLRSILARCSIVNYNEVVVYDKYVRPVDNITDYRTELSGITAELLNDKSSILVEYKQVQREVSQLVKHRIVVGHSVHSDLQSLQINHPKQYIRDTAYCKLLCPQRPLPLKKLMYDKLRINVQNDQHDSIEDAISALKLYKLVQVQWEQLIQQAYTVQHNTTRHNSNDYTHEHTIPQYTQHELYLQQQQQYMLMHQHNMYQQPLLPSQYISPHIPAPMQPPPTYNVYYDAKTNTYYPPNQ